MSEDRERSRLRIPFGGRGRGSRSTSSMPPPYVCVPVLFAGSVMGYAYYSCLDEAPYTKRKRLLATSPEMERRMGDDQYKQLLKQYKGQILPPDHRASITVRRVGGRIADAATDFAKQFNVPLSSSKPTYTVVRSDIPNAFVLPNNHIFVLTGLFNFARDEDELAAVLGHEMAHNLARHAGEKISNTVLIQIMARVLLVIDPTGVLFTLFMPAATLFRDLPHSREAEVEADNIGLYLASEACYDPRAASKVFSAMKEASGSSPKSQLSSKSAEVGAAPPEFLSTHPSYDSRLSNFSNWMPGAMDRYHGDGGMRCQHVREEMKRARQNAHSEASKKEEAKTGHKSSESYRDDAMDYRW